MIEDLNPTTRRYPRTLNEAFPLDADRASWLEAPEPEVPIWNKLLAILALLGWCVLLWHLAGAPQ